LAVTGDRSRHAPRLDAPVDLAGGACRRERIGWISTFDTDGLPVRVAERSRIRPGQVVSAKEARKLERNVLLGVAAGREALADAGLNGFDPNRVGIVFGSAIGGVPASSNRRK